MLISDHNRERNRKKKEDSTTKNLSSVFHALNLVAIIYIMTGDATNYT
jgi:hypothetical protein